MAKKKKKQEGSSIEDLRANVVEIDREIFALRNELAVNRKLDKPHLLKAKRKEKARLLTQKTLLEKARMA